MRIFRHIFQFSIRMSSNEAKKSFERLPSNVVPVLYKLKLEPNLKTFEFKGQLAVDVKITGETSSISLNCADIKISQAQFSSLNEPGNCCYEEEDQKVQIKFNEPLKKGEGTLNLTFTGELNDKMRGFYRSKYITPTGEEKFAAVTQFEPSQARRAFPCWDEPAVKSQFDISFVVDPGYTALSNMPVKNEEKVGDKLCVYFDRTPIMSTYLLAFIVGEYEFVEGTDTNGVVHRVYTPLGKKDQGNFALNVSMKTLPYYSEYFGIAYPLPKVDLIGIPDFAAGAMENWGLITYRESALLVDEENAGAAKKEHVALIVGHELAHQWFGNLVTMEWWTHLWLNEGFATWIEYLCVDYVHPEYKVWDQFLYGEYSSAMELDGLHNSHPIEVPVGRPEEVEEIFDSVSYAKGSAIIRMLHNYLGPDAFRSGLGLYLQRHKYKNTQTEDLWDALAEVSKKPVEKVMNTWTKQKGYPLVSVQEKFENGKHYLVFSQSKFNANGISDGGKSLWCIPINIASSKTDFKKCCGFVMETATYEYELPQDYDTNCEVLKINPGGVDFYRTKYSDGMLHKLMESIEKESLPIPDRLLLLSDLFAMAKSGNGSTVDVLKIMQSFRSETDYTIWQAIVSKMADINLIMQYTGNTDQFDKFAVDLFSAIFEKLGWEMKANESHFDTKLRPLVIGTLGRKGHPAVLEESRKRFEEHYTGKQAVPADLRNAVFSTVMRHGGQAEIKKMQELAKKTTDSTEIVRLQRSLGHVKSEQDLKSVFEYALSENVRTQDFVYVVSACTHSVLSRDLTWDFLKQNWALLKDKFDLFLLAFLVEIGCSSFASEEKAKDIEEFFKKNPTPGAVRTVQQCLENIRLNAAWKERDGKAISEFLQ